MKAGIHPEEQREAIIMSLTLIEPGSQPGSDAVSILEEQLAAQINYLIEKDFNRLLNLLYRIDVSEDKIKKALLDNTDPAGQVIAQLIIERQLQKIASRKRFKEEKGL